MRLFSLPQTEVFFLANGINVTFMKYPTGLAATIGLQGGEVDLCKDGLESVKPGFGATLTMTVNRRSIFVIDFLVHARFNIYR